MTKIVTTIIIYILTISISIRLLLRILLLPFATDLAHESTPIYIMKPIENGNNNDYKKLL